MFWQVLDFDNNKFSGLRSKNTVHNVRPQEQELIMFNTTMSYIEPMTVGDSGDDLLEIMKCFVRMNATTRNKIVE